MAYTFVSPNELTSQVGILKAMPIFLNYQSAPAAITAVTTAQVYGLGAAGLVYTPQFLSRVKVTITGGLVNSATYLTTVKLIMGTGTPTASGSAVAAGTV